MVGLLNRVDYCIYKYTPPKSINPFHALLHEERVNWPNRVGPAS